MVTPERLKSFPAFARLPEAVVGRLAGSTTEEEIPEGDVVFVEGKNDDAIYFIVQGEVVIRKAVDRKEGSFKVLALLGPGEFFGEMALLEKMPRSAAAVAHTAVSLLRLPGGEFQRLLDEDPRSAMELFRGIVTTLSARLRQTSREMVAVFEVGRTLAQELDVKTLSLRVLALARQSLEDDVFGAFYSWNQFTSEYELAGVEGAFPQILRHNRPALDPLFRWMSERKACFLSKAWTRDERFSDRDHALWHGFISMLAAPVFGYAGAIGFIVFGHGSRPGVFTSGHRQVLAGVANLVAPAFENAAWRQEMESKRRLERAKIVTF